MRGRNWRTFILLLLMGLSLGCVTTLAGDSKCYCVSGPDPISVCPGSIATFAVTASGEELLAYQWFYGSTALSDGGDIDGATTPQLQISNVQSADAGEYSVLVSGVDGSVKSDPATLTVKAPTTITNEPIDVDSCPGEPVSFSVLASGEGVLTYQWHYNSTSLADGPNVSGATTPTLQIYGVQAQNAGNYSVSVTGECGVVTSRVAILVVKAPTLIESQPVPLSLCPGENATFSITASGEGALNYQWVHNSVPVENSDRVTGANSARLQIANVQAADAGDYAVSVIGECGTVSSAAATLAVKLPTVISTPPASANVVAETSTRFSVTASGEGALTYQWFHNSVPLSDGGRISGATASELHIAAIEEADAGQYAVTITGECGEASASARLTVQPAIGELSVILATQPKDLHIVLDLSSSMEESVAGQVKITVAKETLAQLINALPRTSKVGLRTFHRCERSDLEIAIQPLSGSTILRTIQDLDTFGTTPLAYTLRQIPEDLAGLEGPHVILFITDGMETCNEDPVAAAATLYAARLNTIFYLIGFDVSRYGRQAGEQLQAIANAAHGEYMEANSGEELLNTVLRLILPPRYHVYDSEGQLVREGTVGDAPFELIVGTYSIVLDTDPATVYENITIRSNRTVTITIP